jgi:hypothetical protein
MARNSFKSGEGCVTYEYDGDVLWVSDGKSDIAVFCSNREALFWAKIIDAANQTLEHNDQV